jgi:NADH:ubiquinone reductase (H+-translocating)
MRAGRGIEIGRTADVSATETSQPNVLIVGGGFAGVGCAKELAKHGVPVTLFDRNNYHQFQPLLYQVATAELAASDVARPLRAIFKDEKSVDVKSLDVAKVDAASRTVTTADGQSFTGDYLVLAAGSQPNFFGTPGADEHSFPLYTLDHAKALRTRLFELYEAADADPRRVEAGALNIVIVGAGPTGVETAGAIADLVNDVMPDRFRSLDVKQTRITLVDHGDAVLAAFSEKAHGYAKEKLEERGVTIELGVGVTEVGADHVVLSDARRIPTHLVVWGGGIKAPDLVDGAGFEQGRGGRLRVQPDLRVAGAPGVYAIGDIANIPGPDGADLPQLGSVALQAGRCAGENILAEIAGKEPEPFHYKDKGIMAMIGDGAAIAEMGAHHHEVHGHVAFAAWLGVHAWLMSGVHQRVDAFVSWGWDFFGSSRSSSIIDDPDSARIDWGDEDEGDGSA